MKKSFSVADIAAAVFGLVIFIGSFTFFAACSVEEKVMSCHYAQVMVTGLGAVITVCALAALCIPDKRVKAGLDGAIFAVSVLTAMTPSVLIPLCAMPDMHCRTVTQPFTVLFAALTALSALAAAVLNWKRKEK